MAVTYFGLNENGASAQKPNADTHWNNPAEIVYTCPGAGAQDIKELGARVYEGSTGYIRLAVYETDGTFICQGSAQLDTEPQGDTNWLSHTAFTNVGGDPISPQLTGGTAYIIAIAGDGDCYVQQNAVSSGDMVREYDSYLAGFPATITKDADVEREWCVRCGVEAASAGGSIVPIICSVERRRRMQV